MKLRNVLAATALVLSAALPAHAGVITSLYSTGVDNAGVATTGNGVDLHWSLTGGTAYTGGTNGVFPIGPWLTETATSRWITSTPNAANDVGSPFVYTTTFSLTGFKAASASISGVFVGDNGVTAIFLNGTLISTGADGFGSFTAFNSGGASFLASTNTLTFDLRNDGGPAGLRVEVVGTAATVPDPATWGLLVAGLGLVGFTGRRRAVSAAV